MNLCGKAARLVRVCRNAAANCFGQPVVVLTYHRVAVLRDDPEQLAVSSDRFRRQLEFLRSNYPILRFDEPWGKPERMSFVITFDDGYADNLTAALPILREFDCPAAFFICAGGSVRSGSSRGTAAGRRSGRSSARFVRTSFGNWPPILWRRSGRIRCRIRA